MNETKAENKMNGKLWFQISLNPYYFSLFVCVFVCVFVFVLKMRKMISRIKYDSIIPYIY